MQLRPKFVHWCAEEKRRGRVDHLDPRGPPKVATAPLVPADYSLTSWPSSTPAEGRRESGITQRGTMTVGCSAFPSQHREPDQSDQDRQSLSSSLRRASVSTR